MFEAFDKPKPPKSGDESYGDLPIRTKKNEPKENAMLDYVLENAKKDNADSVIKTIDKFCSGEDWVMKIREDKAEILDRIVEEV